MKHAHVQWKPYNSAVFAMDEYWLHIFTGPYVAAGKMDSPFMQLLESIENPFEVPQSMHWWSNDNQKIKLIQQFHQWNSNECEHEKK